MAASPANLAGPWAAPIALTAVLLVILAFYARGWFLLAREAPGRVAAWSFGCFVAGLVTIWVAWTTWLATLTHYLLIAHMVQHLLLALAAPPLLLLGCPGLALLRGLRRGPGRDPSELFQSPGSAWARRMGVLVTHPVFAGVLMVAVTIAWHLPPVFKVAMASPFFHTIEDVTFLGSGILFWWPVILPWPSTQHWPRWAVPIYLLGFDMPVSVLCAYLAFCGHVIYPAYLTVPRLFAISALNDQVAAAMLMWVAMLFVFLVAAVAVLLEVLEPSWGHSLEIGDPLQPQQGFVVSPVAPQGADGAKSVEIPGHA